jgi:hypothetical protein
VVFRLLGHCVSPKNTMAEACANKEDLKQRLDSKSPLGEYMGVVYDNAGYTLANAGMLRSVLQFLQGVSQPADAMVSSELVVLIAKHAPQVLHPFIHLTIYSPLQETHGLLACLFAYLLVCLFACLLVCLFACLLVCLFACMHVCLFVFLVSFLTHSLSFQLALLFMSVELFMSFLCVYILTLDLYVFNSKPKQTFQGFGEEIASWLDRCVSSVTDSGSSSSRVPLKQRDAKDMLLNHCVAIVNSTAVAYEADASQQQVLCAAVIAHIKQATQPELCAKLAEVISYSIGCYISYLFGYF